jgi:hypothetical protein
MKTFGSSVIDEAIGISNIVSKLQILTISLCSAWLIYSATIPCTGLVTRARVASTKREQLQILQSEFTHEYKNQIEQALFHMMTRPILETMEYMLAMSSSSASEDMHRNVMRIAGTYSTNYDIFYYSLLSQLETRIRAMEVTALVRSVQPSAQFTTLLFRLIRESEDELARNLMVFHQNLTDVSGQMKVALIDTIHGAYIATQSAITQTARNMLVV